MAESQDVEAQWRLELKDLPTLRRLGRGLSGYFYETTSGGKKCARKDFPLGSAERNSVFEREVKEVCKLDNHPNVVKCFGYTVGRNSCSLVQEYVADNLQNSVQRRIDQEVIRKRGTSTPESSRVLNLDEIKLLLSSGGKEKEKEERKVADAGAFEAVPEAADIISQIATGMRHLHENGVVHGDLKPRNVLVLNSDQSGGWKVKLADYGLTETKKNIRMVSERTRRAEILTWKAPECLGKNLNHGSLDDHTDSDEESRGSLDDYFLTESDTDSDEETHVDEFFKSKSAMADVYSFGLTCSYILNGEPMSSGMSLTQSRQQRMQGFKPKLPESASLEDLKLVIGACLEPEPLKRPTFSIICRMEVAPSHLRLQMLMDMMEGGGRERVPQIPSEVGLPGSLQDRRRATCRTGEEQLAGPEKSSLQDRRSAGVTHSTPVYNDIFQMNAGYDLFNQLASGLNKPHLKIKAKILLQKVLSRAEMTKLKQNLAGDMKMVSDQRDNRYLIVSGIPPDYQYNAQSILKEVKRFDKGARILP